MDVVLRRYIDFLILLIPTPLVSVLFCSSIPTFLFIFFNVLYIYISYVRPFGPGWAPRECATRKRIAGRIRVRGYTWSAQSGRK